LNRELRLYGELIDLSGFTLETIYFGGGTPSILSNKNIASILENINNIFSITSHPEITIEANPDTLTPEKLKFYKESGINRISLGIQSILDKNLEILGRNHRSKEIYNVAEMIKSFDFQSANFDFIYHIPRQNMEELEKEFEFIDLYNPQHLSFYGLILEEDTEFFRRYNAQLEEPEEEELYSNMYLFISEKLRNMGYNHYEISNFAKDGHICRHNMAYWDFSEYLGLGPASSSYIDGKRFKNDSSLENYLKNIHQKKLSIMDIEYRQKKDILMEKILVGLRKIPGLNLYNLSLEYKFDVEEVLDKIKNFLPEYLWIFKKPFINLTEEGFLMSSTIVVEVYNIILPYLKTDYTDNC
jgi:oxygen-independent coproporphyrinogen-3 oxidase